MAPIWLRLVVLAGLASPLHTSSSSNSGQPRLNHSLTSSASPPPMCVVADDPSAPSDSGMMDRAQLMQEQLRNKTSFFHRVHHRATHSKDAFWATATVTALILLLLLAWRIMWLDGRRHLAVQQRQPVIYLPHDRHSQMPVKGMIVSNSRQAYEFSKDKRKKQQRRRAEQQQRVEAGGGDGTGTGLPKDPLLQMETFFSKPLSDAVDLYRRRHDHVEEECADVDSVDGDQLRPRQGDTIADSARAHRAAASAMSEAERASIDYHRRLVQSDSDSEDEVDATHWPPGLQAPQLLITDEEDDSSSDGDVVVDGSRENKELNPKNMMKRESLKSLNLHRSGGENVYLFDTNTGLWKASVDMDDNNDDREEVGPLKRLSNKVRAFFNGEGGTPQTTPPSSSEGAWPDDEEPTVVFARHQQQRTRSSSNQRRGQQRRRDEAEQHLLHSASSDSDY